MIRFYLAALSHFEVVVVNSYLALISHNNVARLIDSQMQRAFKEGDQSAAERLNVTYNALKHFNENVEKKSVPDVPSPLWLVSDGIECVGSKGEVKLYFAELVDILRDLEQDARFVSEEVFNLAAERSAKPS